MLVITPFFYKSRDLLHFFYVMLSEATLAPRASAVSISNLW